jgi:hypothetical protein
MLESSLPRLGKAITDTPRRSWTACINVFSERFMYGVQLAANMRGGIARDQSRDGCSLRIRAMLERTSATNRSSISNGSRLLAGVDGRSAPARRFRDLVHDFSVPLGGAGNLSPLDLALVRQAASLRLRFEQMEAAVAREEPIDDDQMIRLSSEVRRVISAIRKQDAGTATPGPSLSDYLASTEAALGADEPDEAAPRDAAADR